MKLSRYFRLFLLIGILAMATVQAQVSFESGVMGVALNDLGRVQIGAPTMTTQQFTRLSLLVATSPKTVFNYIQDPDNAVPASSTPTPPASDAQLNVLCNNSYSNLPPVIHERVTVYAWKNAGYAIIKYTVINKEAAAINAVNGLEILPRVDHVYGDEIVKYLAEPKVTAVYKANATFTGVKFFQPELVSLKAIKWFDGYSNPDDSLYSWMMTKTLQPEFKSDSDGSVVFMGLNEIALAPGDSTFFFIGVATGKDEASMLANMTLASTAYQTGFTGISTPESFTPGAFSLLPNYPNPFNPSTRIPIHMAAKSRLSLEIFNLLGQKVRTLFQGEMAAGWHEWVWDGLDDRSQAVQSGIYFYRLQIAGSPSEQQMRKMILSR